MDIRLTTTSIQEVSCDALVLAATAESQQKSVTLATVARSIDEQLGGAISESCAAGEFKAGLGELLTFHPLGKLPARRVIVVGLGSDKKVNAQSFRRASATVTRHLQNTGAQNVAFAFDWAASSVDTSLALQATTEGAVLGAYTFRKYQTQDKSREVASLTIVSNDPAAQQAIDKGRALAEAANFARDLINEPSCVLTPRELANRAVSMAKKYGILYEVFDKEKIQELQMGGLLGVSQGSAEPPRFIILRYNGAEDKNAKHLALVGKGITFDTGGISLKPAAGMESMKGDMGGAAAVLGAMQAIASLKPKINVTAYVPTCENMPSGSSYKPGDILRIMNGKTIEIVNTDAEGRLILADALSYACKEGQKTIIDLATLTGAMVVALGTVYTGVFSNSEELTQRIIDAGKLSGEKYWPMPMDEEYGEQIKSEIADIKQTGGRHAGSITAAKILENFVDDAQWAHLDIAGTSAVDTGKPYQEVGGTGVGVRTLAELALRIAQEAHQ
ncbi:leucyl aminopeptidase [Thermosporothrix hazakensis]|jgi:leucyl aminopeptidase|uniref:Probable cytosol aminopeptidase n=1 Tax=Thermosporothrix hazakensis TaxID=644383 RepID=A0A326UCQ9_THEHA|nr:leucyl aminopeptidase [Thermosporothrix hazakensis]PZW36287.1 leucyl aminopeptidase [Thermosporothrix hazakensis]GCE46937.1 putative cytosol aminopeptidase [Thermosporothrix hazakensis]